MNPELAKENFNALVQKVPPIDLTYGDLWEFLKITSIQHQHLSNMVTSRVIKASRIGGKNKLVYAVTDVQRAYEAMDAKKGQYHPTWEDISNQMRKIMVQNGEIFFVEEMGQLVIANMFARFGE